MKVVRNRSAPNLTLCLKINLCDLRVSQFPAGLANGPAIPEAKAGAFAYYARHQLAIVAIAEPFPISGLTIS